MVVLRPMAINCGGSVVCCCCTPRTGFFYVDLHWNQSVSGVTTICLMQCIELIRLLIVACGMLVHSSSMAVRSCWILAGTGTRCRIRRSRASQTCSMGDMSGEYAGHARTGMFSASRNCVQILATWGRALSCCNMRWCEHLPTQVGHDDELESGRDPDEDDEHADELPWDGFWQFVQKSFGNANRLL